MGRGEHFAAGATETYRNATSVSPERYGVRVVPSTELPKEVVAHHEMLGPNNDKHGTLWTGAKVETVPATARVTTSQPALGLEHVEKVAAKVRPGARPVDFKDKGATDEDQDDGRPRLIRHGGELYHVDGLHRLAGARAKDRGVRARVYDLDTQAEKPSYGAAPADHRGLIGHVSEDHANDNALVDSDTDWKHHEVADYHRELHDTGVADHRHA